MTRHRLASSHIRLGFGVAPQPREEVLEIECRLKLRNELAVRLNAHAVRLKRAPGELLADIIERVLQDDLVVAVLDETAA